MNIESNPQLAFILGVLSTIVISVFANLITPDRKTLIENFRNWYAELSKKRAIARINALEKEMSMVSGYVKSPDTNAMHFREETAWLFRDLSFAGFSIILGMILDERFFLRFLLLFGLFMFMRINQRATRVANMLMKINDFDTYKMQTEISIQRLEKVVQSDVDSNRPKTG